MKTLLLIGLLFTTPAAHAININLPQNCKGYEVDQESAFVVCQREDGSGEVYVYETDESYTYVLISDAEFANNEGELEIVSADWKVVKTFDRATGLEIK